MYCIKCGSQNTETTRYCNRCGTNLEELREVATHGLPPPTTSTPVLGPSHVWFILLATVALAIVGLGTVFGCLIALANSPLAGTSSLAPTLLLLGLGGVSATAFMVSRMVRLMTSASQRAALQQGSPPAPRIAAQPDVALPEPPHLEPVASVVEHTTSRLPDYAPPPREGPPRHRQ
jgi:hypothetical protein